MSDDPETARQIAELARDHRPLLVVDVDDVLIEFIRPLPRYLQTRGFELRLGDFRLTGNIFDRSSGLPAERVRVAELLGDFYAAQADWQQATHGAVAAMADIARYAEIVLLTAMPHRYRTIRRAHLNQLGFPYPLLTTEMAKGPAVDKLRGGTQRPVAFVDDQPRNLASVQVALPEAHLFHLTADTSLRAIMPALPEDTIVVEDWLEALPKISAALGLPAALDASSAGG